MFKKKKNKPIVLSEGIELSQRQGANTQKRIWTLLMKGFMVYLVVMGQTGCLLSSLGIAYNVLMVNFLILAGSLFCALLYYSKLWENLGYILLFVFMLFTAIQLRNYISSGFFAVVNNMAEKAAVFFGTEVIQGFKERLPNRYMTVTISSIYVGWVNAILFNVIISRRMKYMLATLLSLSVLLVPFYLEKEPDLLYTVMLLSGLILTWMMRGAEHFDITPDNNRFIIGKKQVGLIKKKPHINFIYDIASHARIMAAVIAGTMAVTFIFGIISPRSQYASIRKTSAWKEETKGSFENLYKLGIWGLFNMYPNTGGLSSGILGGVNSVQLDYETDLKVTFVPYDTKRIYLRTFTGAQYLPFENRWLREATGDVPRPESTSSLTGRILKQFVEENESKKASNKTNNKQNNKSAKAKIRVENTAAAIGVYLPYYMDTKDGASEYTVTPGAQKEMEFYPALDREKLSERYAKIIADIAKKGEEKKQGKAQDNKNEIQELLTIKREVEDASNRIWRTVPDENKEVVTQFCKDAGLTGREKSIDELIKKLQDYYQKEIPYSYQPGLTPNKKDFVNYFLSENKKGYCAHFASAAVLIFRSLGIPARYVEGYVVDPSDIASDGTVLRDIKSEDYYEGYNALSNKEVVEVEVSDAAAHAWIEVYDIAGGGWKVADVTPYSTESPPSIGFLAGLLRMLSGDDSDAVGGTSDASGITDGLSEPGAVMQSINSIGYSAGVVVFSIIGVIVLVIFIRFVIKKLTYAYRYAKADKSGKLVMEFEKFAAKHKCASDGASYKKRIKVISDSDRSSLSKEEGKLLADEMEKAAFSGKEVDSETYSRIHKLLKKR